jgi:hypothetical protein
MRDTLAAKEEQTTICDRVHGARAVTRRRMVDGYHVNDHSKNEQPLQQQQAQPLHQHMRQE